MIEDGEDGQIDEMEIDTWGLNDSDGEDELIDEAHVETDMDKTCIWNKEKDKDRENKMVVDKVSVIWVNVEGLDG